MMNNSKFLFIPVLLQILGFPGVLSRKLRGKLRPIPCEYHRRHRIPLTVA